MGAKDASHAKYHTAASLSHIKVSIREDNLGLGARVGAAGGEWETTGLSGFQDLLGRLNGKSEADLGNAQRIRANLKRSMYAEQRWGTLRFVSGGLLIGDKIEELKKEVGVQEKKMVEVAPTLRGKHQDGDFPKIHSRKQSKELGKVDSFSLPMPNEDAPSVSDSAGLITVPTAQVVDEAQSKAYKTERKLQRRLKKKARLERKGHTPANCAVPSLSAQAHSMKPLTVKGGATSSYPSNGIQAVRHRSIKHKKMAVMDNKALNEVSLFSSLDLGID